MCFALRSSLSLFLVLALSGCDFGWPAISLHDAAQISHVGQVKRNLRYCRGDCGLDSPDDEDRTPLQWAAEKGSAQVAQLLIEAGANIHLRDSFGTPLMRATFYGHPSVIRVLLSAGARPDARGAEKQSTPLHGAAMTGKPKITQLLLENGADIDARDEHGNTPLHYTARYAFTEIARILAAAGADVDAVDKNGVSPIVAAQQSESHGVVRVLESFGAMRADADS